MPEEYDTPMDPPARISLQLMRKIAWDKTHAQLARQVVPPVVQRTICPMDGCQEKSTAFNGQAQLCRDHAREMYCLEDDRDEEVA